MDKGRILTIAEKSEVFRHPGSSAAARLTGCKSVVRAEKAGKYQVRVPEWGCTMGTAEEVPDGLTAIGVRAHDFIPAVEDGPGMIGVTTEQMTEYPFEWDAISRTAQWRRDPLEGGEKPPGQRNSAPSTQFFKRSA